MVQEYDDRYTVDIRVFVGMIVTAMAISFGVGVGMGPTATDLLQATMASVPVADSLPRVTSVNLETPLGVPASDDLHEPAGQVSSVLIAVLMCLCGCVWLDYDCNKDSDYGYHGNSKLLRLVANLPIEDCVLRFSYK